MCIMSIIPNITFGNVSICAEFKQYHIYNTFYIGVEGLENEINFLFSKNKSQYSTQFPADKIVSQVENDPPGDNGTLQNE